MAANWPDAGRDCRVAKDGCSRHAWRDLLEQLQPFAAHAEFECHESGGVAARPRQAVDKAGADRIGTTGNTMGTVRVACRNGATVELPWARMTSGASAANSAACLRISAASAAGPANIDLHVAADRSSPIAPGLLERPTARLEIPHRRRAWAAARQCAERARAAARALRAAIAAALPSSAMNSRRLMMVPRVRGQTARSGSNR